MDFDKHLEDNQELWEMFVKYSVNLGEKKKRFSAAGIFHLMRYETLINQRGSSFKLDQNWSPYYARKFIEDYPQYDVFKIKELNGK